MDSCNKNSTPEQEALWARLKERINRPGSFSVENGMTVTEVKDHWCRGELAVRPSSLNPRGSVHGGCLCTLMDTVAGVAACTDGRGCVTLNCSISYLRPARDTGKVYCETRLIKGSRSTVVMEAILTDDRDKLVATGTYTFFLLEELAPILRGEGRPG